jgi:hypothetical protein
MNRFTSAPLLLGFLVLTNPIVSLQDPAHREKVAEGEYSEWQDGHPLKDTGLTWTIWHTKDGFEVGATLPPDKGAFIAAALAGPGSTATAEFKKEIQNSLVTRTIDLQLTKLLVLQRMILEGVSLGDLKQVRVANCQVSENEISCERREGTLRVKSEGPLQLVYCYPFPFPTSFTPILKNNKPAQNQGTPIKLALLEEVKHKLQLTEVSGHLHAEGTEKLTIGENVFDTDKYLLVLATKAGERKMTLWTRNHETVFAMEDSMLGPGLRIQLNQYKRYSDF